MPRNESAKREANAKASRERSDNKREFTAVPPIKNVKRRERCRDSLKLFCETYNPAPFYFGWSESHLKAISRIEEAVTHGALFAFAMPRGSGKALALDTPIPTPNGWTTMRAVRVGDTLYDSAGSPCRVTFATEIQCGRECYRVEFDDGESVVCDAEHLWTVNDRFSRNNPLTLRTVDMIGRVTLSEKRGWSEYRYTIPICQPIAGQSADWVIHPYILGAWLGDGHTVANSITIGSQDLEEMRRLIERHESFNSVGRGLLNGTASYTIGKGYGRGHRGTLTPEKYQTHQQAIAQVSCGTGVCEVARSTGLSQATVSRLKAKPFGTGKASLLNRLKWIGVIGNKHIPQKYLRASEADRMSLLRGLMDTDGSINPEGTNAEYVTKLPQLRDDVMELLAGLGFKRRCREKVIRGRTYYRITFSPTDGRRVFDLTRKAARQQVRKIRISATRRIVSITAVPSVPVRCVQVDSPSRLYLCGRGMVPTHNTTLCRMALLWATAYAHCRYVFLIGATSDKAEDTLDSVKMSIRFLKDFADDFPEISFPANRLEGIANRASGQKCDGESTLIEWSKNTVVLPTVPVPANWPKKWKKRSDGKAPTSGVILATSGLTGEGIRGSLKTLTNGEYIRPDLVLLDDPQTTESACSLAQNAKRMSLITSDVLGMAGPGRSLAGVMPCTVIARGDMVDEVLDRKKHPLWRGERTKMLKTFPADLKAWDNYFDVYERCALSEPPDFTESNEYYEANRAALDAGAEATWVERRLKTEVSAVQSAMHLYHRDNVGFMAEYQNEPLDITLLPGSRRLTMDNFVGRHTGLPRGVVPRDCSKVTAFIDLGGYLHWYAIVAWNDAFGGSVIDYGSWPRQGNLTYTKEDARMKLEDAYPGHSQDQYVYQGLVDLGGDILTREYMQENTGAGLRIEIAVVDSGFKDDIASDFVRAAATRGTRLEISKGVPRTTGRSPVGKWEIRPGENGGWNWRRSLSVKKKAYMIQFDTDAFKGFVYDRWTERVGGRSCMRIFGDERTDHRLFFGHQTAECGRVDPEKKSGEQEKWSVVPNSGVDNDFFDCVVGAAVAASVSGLKWAASGMAVPPKAGKPISLRELQQQRRAEKERRVGA